MNKIKLALSAVAVFCVVGGALAFNVRAQQDLRICNAQKICVLPPANTANSTVPGIPVANPGNLYQGPVNSSCETPNSPCKPFSASAQVYINN